MTMRCNLMLSAAAAATGLIAVRAEDPPADDDAVLTAVRAMRTGFEARMDTIESGMNELAIRAAMGGILHSGEGGGLMPVDGEYTGHFAAYARRGAPDAQAALRTANETGERAAIQAAMTEGDQSSGGYLAPTEWDRQIQKAQRALSPVRRISRVQTTGRSEYMTLWSNDLFGSGWVGETAARPQTTANSFSKLLFPAGEIYAQPAITQRLLDDSAIDLDQWMAENLSDEFTRQESIAFVSGNGVNKPMGFLQYLPGGAASAAILDGSGNVTTAATAAAHPGGNLGVTVSANASAIPNTDVLVDLKYGLGAPYRQNATWLMNSQTAAYVAKMKDGQGNYVWRESLMEAEPSRLLGRPVEIEENMPNIGAGSYPIAFGDFARGYLVNDRIGVRILRDPYTAKPFVLFYATKRVGGGVLDPFAIKVLKIAAS